MSYNGSGTFVINSSGQPVVTGTVISSTAFNALTADLATGLSTCVTKDGQTTTTARILFAQGISSTLTTDSTSATTGSIITAGGISTQKALWVGTTSRHVGATQFDAAITYGGVTLSNAVTGTGNMVLSASPTLTGTLTAAAITASGKGTFGTGVTTGLEVQSTNGTVPITLTPAGGQDVWKVQAGILVANDFGIINSTRSVNLLTFTGGAGTSSAVLTGNLGIGMTPVNVLDITQSLAGAATIKLLNSNAGTTAEAVITLSNGTRATTLSQIGASFTASGIYRQSGTYLASGGEGGLTLATTTAQPIYFAINSVEKMRLDASGNLGVGMTPATTLDVAGTIRVSGSVTPASGAGVELIYTSSIGTIFAYDRSGAVYKELNLAGLGVSLLYQGTKMLSITGGGAGAGVKFPTYGAGTITADASGNLTAVSDPKQKTFVGSFRRGLADILAIATDEFMGLHKWNEGSGMETAGTYASFFARDNFPIPEAIYKNPLNGINSFSDRPVLMATVNAIAEHEGRITALERENASLRAALESRLA